MQVVSDLHLHSKYSRAVSQDMVLPIMAEYAKQKGLDLLTAGDFTHPLWFKQLKAQLEEYTEGIYKLKTPSFAKATEGKQNSKIEKETLFLLSTEIASIYKQGDKLRRIHNLVFAPNLETADKITKELHRRGCNLLADGRPIIGLSSKELLELILEIDEQTMLIPCHAWTPHFGIYGSASGFDSLEEAFGDLSNSIYGIETGLSSDPEMNWGMQELMNRSILSFSDAHSPAKMGREATVFELEEPTYKNIKKAIMCQSVISSPLSVVGNKLASFQLTGQLRTDKPNSENRKPKTDNRIIYTIEFYPEEGKYHFSGHRNCNVVYGPEEVKEKGVICPVCHRKLTEGVYMRVSQLADESLSTRVVAKSSPTGLKWYTDSLKIHPPYVKLVPLNEIIAEALESTVFSQKVKSMFVKVCDTFGSELEVLLKTPIDEIAKIGGPKIAEGILKVRKGDIQVNPGFDGEYGKVKIWAEEKSVVKKENQEEKKEQMGLF